MINDVKTVFSGNTSTFQKILAIGDIALNVAMDVSMVVGVGEGARAMYLGAKVAEEVTEHALVDVGEHAAEYAAEDAAEHAAEDTAEHAAEDTGEHGLESGCEGSLSFSVDTLVATPTGEQAIGTLKVGDLVIVYDPQTHQNSVQVVQHIWINHDNDLIDLHLHLNDAASSAKGAATQPATGVSVAPLADETVHTTSKHPFLTLEQGWVKAGQLQPGMHVIRTDGTIGVVEAAVVVPGAATMYNLTVSKLHTYEVGLDRWVLHNCGDVTDQDYYRGAYEGEAPQPQAWPKRSKA